MKATSLFATLLLTITFFASKATAQMALPVQWSFNAVKVNNDEYEVRATANIQNGWYVYSQSLEKEGPIPTTLEIYKNPAIEVNGKPEEVGVKKEDYDKNYDMKIVKLVGEVTIKQRVRLKDAAATVSGVVTFQTCNNEMCIPPQDVPFKVALKKEL
jgi:thiol:disulfide interchange protein